MTAAEYIAWQDLIAELPVSHHCKHGHLNCSDVDGGKCSDEEFAQLSPQARAIVDSNWVA
jgi:hypothetical protein